MAVTDLRRDRVVAVVAELADGLTQVGTGFLTTEGTVLTAGHCVRDKASGSAARALRIFRASDGAELAVSGLVSSTVLDLAVVQVAAGDPSAVRTSGDDPGPDVSPGRAISPVRYGRVDRSRAGVLTDCQAIGYPMFQYEPTTSDRRTAELHGTIYRTDEAETGRLLLREPTLTQVPDPVGLHTGAGWGGLSGALVFHDGLALGVVVEHHPRQGRSAVQLVAFDQLASAADVPTRAVAAALDLPAVDALPWAGAEPVRQLDDLLEVVSGGEPPVVTELTPYGLGATASDYGNSSTYGRRDPYVPRTYQRVDARLDQLLVPGHLVLVVGPSKSGKTRTAFEAIRRRWPTARLVAGVPGSLAELAGHPRLLTTTDPLILWFDDLQRFVTGSAPLTPALLRRLWARPGPTIAVATLRMEEREKLRNSSGELSRDTRALLDDAANTTVELRPTAVDGDEQSAAEAAYPDASLGPIGLGEGLAHAPALLRAYRDGATVDPARSAVVRVAIDWARVGIWRPVPEADLMALARDALWESNPELDVDDQAMAAAVREARATLPGTGRAALLVTYPLPGHVRGYRAFDYLVAADNGPQDTGRGIPEPFWDAALTRCTASDAALVGDTCLYLSRYRTAVPAYRQAADGGETRAMFNLGVLLADVLTPPDLPAARRSYEAAIQAGQQDAALNLGILLTVRLDPPDLPAARRAFEISAAAGDVVGAFNLGVLLSRRMQPPDIPAARAAFEQAATAGHADAMSNLGALLLDQVDPPDLGAARHAFEQAAAAGSANAAYNLGIVLADRFTPPQSDAAARAFQQAAAAGNDLAALRLGGLLEDREPPDLAGARAAYEQAARAGNRQAFVALGLLLAYHWEPRRPADAIAWFEKAATAGETESLVNVGNLLLTGDPPDLPGARSAYERAAAAGHPNAFLNLGTLLLDYLVPPDLIAARVALDGGAAVGSADCAYRLGRLLWKQWDPADIAGARSALERGADLGSGPAALHLASLLLDHFGVDALPEARAAAVRAVELGEPQAWRLLGNIAVGEEPPDLTAARTAYGHAAAAGDADAAIGLGYLLAFSVQPPEPAAALAVLEPLADAGSASASFYLGLVLADVLEPPDLVGARAALSRAAAAGHPEATARLAELDEETGATPPPASMTAARPSRTTS